MYKHFCCVLNFFIFLCFLRIVLKNFSLNFFFPQKFQGKTYDAKTSTKRDYIRKGLNLLLRFLCTAIKIELASGLERVRGRVVGVCKV